MKTRRPRRGQTPDKQRIMEFIDDSLKARRLPDAGRGPGVEHDTERFGTHSRPAARGTDK